MDRDDLDLTYDLSSYLSAFAEGEKRENQPQQAVTGPGRAPNLTVMDPDLAAYLGEFTAGDSTSSSSTGTAQQEAIEVRVVQRALNVLMRAGLAEDGDYGPLTQGALNNWINTLSADARRNVTVMPSADRHWLYIRPAVLVQVLREAGSRPRPSSSTVPQSRLSVGGAATVLLNAYNKAPAFARIAKTYADSHGNQLPTNLVNAYVAWYRSVMALQAVVVNRLRTDPALQRWIAMREGGAHIPSQMATEIEQARPPLPDVQQMRMSLGNPWLIALGIVAAAVAIPLVAHEIATSNEAANRTAQLEAIIRGVGEGQLPPDAIPGLPGGAEEQAEGGGEDEGPFDWLPWTIGGLAVLGVVGLVWYGYVTKDKGSTKVIVGERGTAELTEGEEEDD